MVIERNFGIMNYETFAFVSSFLMVKYYVKTKSTDSPPAFRNWDEPPIINSVSIGIVFLF